MGTNKDDVKWGHLLNTIENEKCILFLGPELFKDANGVPIGEQLSHYLKKHGEGDMPNYYKGDGLFSFKNRVEKTASWYEISKFYKQPFPKTQTILNEIAKIPFHLIVSITPDNICSDVFKNNQYSSESLFYWKKQRADDTVKKPTQKKPIIYNMFGSIEELESMVLSHHDLFDYFESIFQENSMPKNLKLTFKEAQSFIFLGLDLEKWYMQLLLRIMYLHNENYMKYAPSLTLSSDLKAFCSEQFNIEFIPTQINEFVNKLVEKCSEKKLIREKAILNPAINSNDFMTLIEHDKTEAAIRFIERVIENQEEDDFVNKISHLKRDYKRNEIRKLGSQITLEGYDSMTNRIQNSLIQIYEQTRTQNSRI